MSDEILDARGPLRLSKIGPGYVLLTQDGKAGALKIRAKDNLLALEPVSVDAIGSPASAD